jgi:predicted nucleic acid-binding protein
MLVIADTSPLNYLILIDALELLPRLYPQVILPRGAWQELQHADAPAPVKHWAQALPDWIEVREAPVPIDLGLETLGKGEQEAIALAELYRSESPVLLLLDERAAREHAAARKTRPELSACYGRLPLAVGSTSPPPSIGCGKPTSA